MKRIEQFAPALLFVLQSAVLFWIVAIRFFAPPNSPVAFRKHQSAWADSIVQNTAPQELAGQMIMVEIPDFSPQYKDSLRLWSKKYHIGGVLLSHPKPETLAKNIAQCYEIAKIPLFVGLAPENNTLFEKLLPPATAIGAIQDTNLVKSYAKALAKAYQTTKLSISFAIPSEKADSSNFPLRFSDRPRKITQIAQILSRAFENQQIIAGAFPFEQYHHFEKPPPEKLKDSLFFVYRRLKKLQALFLSPEIKFSGRKNELNDFLEENTGFNGLIFAYPPTQFLPDSGALKTLVAGADVVVLRQNISAQLNSFFSQIEKSRHFRKRHIKRRSAKILLAKAWAHVPNPVFSDSSAFAEKQKSIEHRLLNRRLWEKAICFSRNRHKILPLNKLQRRRVLSFAIGKDVPVFHAFLRYHAQVATQPALAPHNDTIAPLNVRKLRRYNPLIISLNQVQPDSLRDSAFFKTLRQLDKRTNIVLVNFGNPCATAHFDFVESIVQAFDNRLLAQEMAAQALAGGIAVSARLPFAVGKTQKTAAGVSTPTIRFKYTLPEELGICSDSLKHLDSIVNQGLKIRAFPGCQVLAAKNGKVFYHKAFGFHSYKKQQPVSIFDLYDLASVTKTAATTIAVMKLVDKKLLNVEDSIKFYMTDTSKSTIKNIRFSELLTHRSGLQANMPIIRFLRFRDSISSRFDEYYSHEEDSIFSLEIAKDFYFKKSYIDTLWHIIDTLSVDTAKNYLYSDVNLNIVYHLIVPLLGEPFDEFLDKNFYAPLGANHACFRPLQRFAKSHIAPTQEDRYWRKQLVRGYVHDPSAALYGGVAGNAGLFANANDLAKIYQMLLNLGVYGGRRYLSSETIEIFTNTYPPGKRGLGFNKSRLNGAFGHTGFTGTCVWADKKTGVLFVFLSNRVHPKVSNKKLQQEGIRQRLRQAIYDALQTYPPPNHKKTTMQIVENQ